MVCNVKLMRKAEKYLRSASQAVVERISERLDELSKNPKCEEKLEPPLEKLCKTRVGSYRIAYYLEPCNITVVYIGHRGSFYEELRHI